MIENIFVELSIIIIIAAFICSILRLLRQPLIIGYILTGVLVSPYIFNVVQSADAVAQLAKIGIALLLFMVGLNLNPKIIKEFGKVSVITGIGQILFTSIIGFLIGYFAFNFSFIVSMYIGIALTFSSTIVIMKLISDKGEMESLYGRISIGFLLVQDLVAILILMGLSMFMVSSASIQIFNLLYAVLGILALILFSFLVLPRISNFLTKSQEYLYLFIISWVLIWTGIFEFTGLSIEIGALLSGITLSMLPYKYEISSKVKPLRDFFIILFFVFLGLQMQFTDIQNFIVPVIVFSAFVLIGNPLLVMIIMGASGYTKKTSFLSGLTVAQISEFSLLLIILGISLGHLTGDILSLLTLIGLITITISSYMIIYSNKLYLKLSYYLSVFEIKGKKADEHQYSRHKNYDSIIFGYNRVGFDIVEELNRMKKKFLVVDFNPQTIKKLKNQKIDCIYGDADDIEFLNSLNLQKFKIVISTIGDFETNMLLMDQIKKDIPFICVSREIEDSLKLYKRGATYVIMPHFLGGPYVSRLLEKNWTNKKLYTKQAEKHIKNLKKRKEMGNTHSRI